MIIQKYDSMQEIFNNNRYQLKYAAVMSSQWFNEQARLLKMMGATPGRMLKDNDESKWVNRIVPGRLYLYKYDAKHKATLPYWDQYPLVFPYAETEDRKGFYGLNMHYIPYEYRIKILDSLIKIDLSKYSDNKKLKVSWDIIKGSSTLKPLKPCVHMYLYNHLRSGMKQIQPKDWATAMMMPIQSWVGSNNTNVWKDSKNKMV